MSKDKNREPDYGKDNKVTVRNDFIKANYPQGITAVDLKLLRLVISQCRKHDTEFMEYTFQAKDIAEQFNMDSANVYRAAHESVERLFGCNIKIGTEKKYELLHIFQTAKYDSGTFTMQLSGEVEKLFLRLKRDFTNMPLLPILAMRNKNSIRIYELICEKFMGQYPFADTATEVILTARELREITETTKNKSYDHIGHLRNKIITPALSEIEAAADWKIFCNDLKTGRKVTAFRLEVWSRNGWEYIEDCKRKGIIPEKVEQIPGQQSIFDYL